MCSAKIAAIQMIQQRKRPTERLAGIVALFCAAPWTFKGVLMILDWISRVQTVVAVEPHLWIFGTPLGFAVEFLVLISSLFYATRLEHSREIDETPRVILAYSNPAQPKNRRIWIKLTGGMILLSAFAALLVFLYQSNRRVKAAIVRPLAPMPVVPKSPSTPPSSIPKHPPDKEEKPAGSAPSKGERQARKPLDPPVSPAPKPTIEIPVPNQTATKPLERHDQIIPVARINQLPVRAGEKPPGKRYLVLRLSEVSIYRGSITENDLKTVKIALEKTGTIAVFTGDYTLEAGNKTYSIGSLADGDELTTYYFDPSLASSCSAVQSIISSLVGKPMKCHLRDDLRPDPGRLNTLLDFLNLTGIDFETYL
jgi:hypothetical protein